MSIVKAINKIVVAMLLLAGTMLTAVMAKAEPTVRLDTSMGVIEITLRPDVAPIHVQNFLTYVNDGDYDNSFFHRSLNGFILQGGGFKFFDQIFSFVPTDQPIVNEFSLSNVRGTVAMAKVGGDPDSATSQWFINLADNSANLDFQNEGFTVFGEVTAGMDVADAIAALPIVNYGSPIGSALPMRNLPIANPIDWDTHLVMIVSASLDAVAIPMLPMFFMGLLGLLIAVVAKPFRADLKPE